MQPGNLLCFKKVYQNKFLYHSKKPQYNQHMRNSDLWSILYTGYINKREFIDTLAKIIISYFTFHRLYERRHFGCEFVISYCVQNCCFRFCNYFASEVMVHILKIQTNSCLHSQIIYIRIVVYKTLACATSAEL